VGAAVIVPKGFGEARAAPFSGQRMKLEVAIDPSRQAIGGMLSGILTKYGFMQLQSAFQRPQEMRRLAGESLDRIRKSADLDPARKALFERFFGNLDTMLATIPDAAQDEPEPQPTPDKPGDATPAKKSGGFNWQPLELVEVPVQIKRDFPTNGYSLTFPQGIMWGIMGCSLAFAISLVLERSRGTLMRLRVAPLPPWTILLGKSIACFVVTAGVACTLLAVGVLAFGVRPISYPLLLGAVVCASLCFVGLMNLLAAVSPSERAASGLGWGVMIVLAMVGGVMVPVEFLPEWLQRVGSLSPMRWSLLAMSAGIWRDLPMSRYALACAIQLGVGLVGFVAGVRAFGTAESRA
jgi:ABC-2 type transport system permease protein